MRQSNKLHNALATICGFGLLMKFIDSKSQRKKIYSLSSAILLYYSIKMSLKLLSSRP